MNENDFSHLYDYQLIPGTDGKYEINRLGMVRNVRTKIILKYRRKRCSVVLRIKGKNSCRSVAKMLKAVFGIEIPRASFLDGLTAKKGTEIYRFRSSKDCANFLAPRTYYSVSSVRTFISRRVPRIGGWQIEYPARSWEYDE